MAYNGVSFDLVDEATVLKLQREGIIKVPAKKINVPKDMQWNEKQMSSKVLQGILKGSSIRDIAKSLYEVVGNDWNSAVRNARTMTTAAENGGRLDSYKALEKQGVIQKKVWMATPDDRTRPSHIDLDGEEQDIDQPFSNGCQFPADGNGPAEEVWMCRCTMTDHIIGFKQADGSVSYIDYERSRTMHDEQMEEERERRLEEYSKESDFTTKYIGRKPERPSKSDFDNIEDYHKALDDYKKEREKYNLRVEEVTNEWLNKEHEYVTRSQFEEWAKSVGINVDDSFYKNVDTRLYDEIIKTESEMFSRFPAVKEYQDSYYRWELRYENTGDFLMSANAGLSFGRSFSDANDIYWSVINGQTGGYLTVGDGTLNTLIRHEYGHTADSYCKSKFSTYELTYKDSVSGKMERRIDAAREYRKELYEVTKKYGSEYSMTNDLEAFAEGFAEYTSNPNSEYGKAFGKFFERWYYAGSVE